MTTRRAFLALILPMIAIAQSKGNDCEARLNKCLSDQSGWLERQSTPFNVDSTIRLAIEAKDCDDAAAYQLAIADMIHDHFSNWMVIDPAAKAKVYIRGSRVGDSGVQLVMIDIGWESHAVAMSKNGPVGIMEGLFIYKDAAEILSGTHADRVSQVREIAFRLFSDMQRDFVRFKPKS